MGTTGRGDRDWVRLLATPLKSLTTEAREAREECHQIELREIFDEYCTATLLGAGFLGAPLCASVVMLFPSLLIAMKVASPTEPIGANRKACAISHG